MGVEGGGVDRTWIKAFKGLKKFSGWWWWSPSENSVCPRPLLQFHQFLQFMSVRLRQFTLEGQDVELDKMKIQSHITQNSSTNVTKHTH